MQIINGLDKLKRRIKKPVITIGTFDGIHIGHQKIITSVVKRAELAKGTSTVLTFDFHPLQIMGSQDSPPLLTSLGHKMKLLKGLGVKKCLLIKFKRDFFMLNPEEFVKKILVDRLGVKEIYLGDNYYFGRNKNGDIKLMKSLAGKYSFCLHRVKLIKIDGKVASSSRIRALLKQGNLNQAARFLGRPFSILGQVTKGDRRGRLLGYPTANLKPYHEVIPPSGVYAARISLGRKLYNAILNIGTRPTFEFIEQENIEPIIEVHIFDFNSSLYGRELEVIFIRKIRNEKRFSGQDELLRQIKLDEAKARGLLDSPLQNFSTVVK